MSILFNDITDINKGIKIITNNKDRKINEVKCIHIGLLGNFNTGKTFVISKFTGKYYEQGFNSKT